MSLRVCLIYPKQGADFALADFHETRSHRLFRQRNRHDQLYCEGREFSVLSVKKYDDTPVVFHNLGPVDGPAKVALFEVRAHDKDLQRVTMKFDILHVCPPQTVPDINCVSKLSNVSGWVHVDQATLRHKTHDTIRALGDVMNAPNAAAARMQAPVVAENTVADIAGGAAVARCDASIAFFDSIGPINVTI